MNITTRFAPSPTGYLHLGGLRTALYAYLFTRQQKGTFVLRIEDTDRTRLVPGAVEALIETMQIMGLDFDQGPFLQSERLPLYKKHVDILVAQKFAYPCFCTKERLDDLRTKQQEEKLPMKYDRACLALTDEQIQDKLNAQEPHVIRMRVPEGKTTFTDEVRGEITIENKEIDDQVLLKTDGFPTYHLAVVVDDHDMNISHVIRAEEWISSTPKHVLLYEAFGFELPKFAHLPLILNPDKSKLSKRQGDVAVEDYLAKGYLKEALINFVALLGFNPSGDQEIYTLDELIQGFDLHKINKSGAVFDVEKLNWMNGMYIRTKTAQELMELAKPFLLQADAHIEAGLLERVLEVEKDRLVTLQDIVERIKDYTDTMTYPKELLVWKKSDANDAKQHLSQIMTLLTAEQDDLFAQRELIEVCIKRYIEEGTYQNGNVLWPLRAALSGREKSPNPFELLWIFGKEESLRRLQLACSLLV